MNTVLISILVFFLGTFLGVIGMVALNSLKIKRGKSTALSILEDAKKEAEKNKRESILETKDEIHKLKLESEKEIKEK